MQSGHGSVFVRLLRLLLATILLSAPLMAFPCCVACGVLNARTELTWSQGASALWREGPTDALIFRVGPLDVCRRFNSDGQLWNGGHIIIFFLALTHSI